MSVESDVLTGLATYLNSAGVGVYKPSGGYLDSDIAIVFGGLPTTPDRAIGLTIYSSTDEIKQNLSAFRVQVWCRGGVNNSLAAGDLASSVFDAMQGIEGLALGSCRLVQMYRVSFVPLGIDANKRYERSDNYLVQVNTPNTAGRPL